MTKTFQQTDLLVDQLPAEERAAIIRDDIVRALDDGRFKFRHGYLSKFGPGSAVPQCEFGGCAIAALAYAVAGSRPPSNRSYLVGEVCRQDAIDTGLLTKEEAWELENGYEWNGKQDTPFGRLGSFLREQAHTRGHR